MSFFSTNGGRASLKILFYRRKVKYQIIWFWKFADYTCKASSRTLYSYKSGPWLSLKQ